MQQKIFYLSILLAPLLFFNPLLFAKLFLVNSDGCNIQLTSKIALKLSNKKNNTTLDDISPEVLEKFLNYKEHADKLYAQGEISVNIVQKVSDQALQVTNKEICQLIDCAHLLDQPLMKHIFIRHYIKKNKDLRSSEAFFNPIELSKQSNETLRKHFFLLTDTPEVMTYLDEEGTLRKLTLTLEEFLYVKCIYIENSKLDLSNHFLSSIDGLKYWLDTHHTKQVDLSNNCLKSLPRGIGKGFALQRLDLSNNQIEHLPEEICQLNVLEKLDVSNNKLTSLPHNIGNLKNLMRLDADGNNLTELPESITECKKLCWLSLTANNINSTPSSLKKLENLRKIKI